MYDNDDLFSFFNSYNSGTSTTTETEQKTDTNVGYNTSSNPYSVGQDTGYVDDYTTRQNFEEQKYYQPTQTVARESETVAQTQIKTMDMPTILKEEQAVQLTKTRQKVSLNARMKIIIAMFSVIMAALVFVIAWNFVAVSKINASNTEKLQIIQTLEASINDLSSTYNQVSDKGEVIEKAEQLGYVESDETNTFYVSLDEIPAEPTIEPVSSNWFNDVCEFFSRLFA